MIVVDASAVVDLLLRTRSAEPIERVALLGGDSLHAPSVLDAEVLGAFRRIHRDGALTRGRAEQALVDLQRLPIVQHPPGPLLARAWELRDNLTAMDALYVALAEVLQATFLTTDRRAARAVSALTQVMPLVPDP